MHPRHTSQRMQPVILCLNVHQTQHKRKTTSVHTNISVSVMVLCTNPRKEEHRINWVGCNQSLSQLEQINYSSYKQGWRLLWATSATALLEARAGREDIATTRH